MQEQATQWFRSYFVSIRARHCWRAMRDHDQDYKQVDLFQSAPAIAGGRCMADSWRSRLQNRVSIRARHCWRAMLTMNIDDDIPELFQSAPAIAGGRCIALPWSVLDCPGFNPRPPLLAGDAGGCGGQGSSRCVSIRARHCWRAMPHGRSGPLAWTCFNPRPPLLAGDAFMASLSSSLSAGFNPRPPLLAGDAGAWSTPTTPRPVSIRARHCWRAMRFQPKTLKRLNFFTISREQGAMNWDCSIHHVEKIRKSIQINGLRSARTS